LRRLSRICRWPGPRARGSPSRLRRLREEFGLSQQQVSERSGVVQESLSRLENGRRDPRLETLRKLARGMDMTLPELLQSLSSSLD